VFAAGFREHVADGVHEAEHFVEALGRALKFRAVSGDRSALGATISEGAIKS
jgi:hypothetical protein